MCKFNKNKVCKYKFSKCTIKSSNHASVFVSESHIPLHQFFAFVFFFFFLLNHKFLKWKAAKSATSTARKFSFFFKSKFFNEEAESVTNLEF